MGKSKAQVIEQIEKFAVEYVKFETQRRNAYKDQAQYKKDADVIVSKIQTFIELNNLDDTIHIDVAMNGEFFPITIDRMDGNKKTIINETAIIDAFINDDISRTQFEKIINVQVGNLQKTLGDAAQVFMTELKPLEFKVKIG